MSFFGIGGGNRVKAPAKAPAVVKPKAEPQVKTPTGDLDANATTGLRGWSAGVKAAKTSPLSPTPWSGWGGFLSGLKDRYVQTYTQTAQEKTAAFIAKNDMGPKGNALLTKIANDGKFAKMDAQMNSLLGNVEAYLEKGGRKELALAMLQQIDNPDTIKQANDNTCAGATLQKAVAIANPAKYFRMMTELASTGKTDVIGAEFTLSKESRKDIKALDMPLGDRASAYFQAAMMEAANGDAKYDFSEDKSIETGKNGGKDKEFRGVKFEEARDLNMLLTDVPTVQPERLQSFIKSASERGKSREESVTEYVKRQVDKAVDDKQPGAFLAVHGRGNKPGHMLLVRGVDDQGNFRLTDANGREKVWSPEKLAQRVLLDHDKDVGNVTAMAGTSTTTTTTTYAAPIRRR
jgi:hypothetical protein